MRARLTDAQVADIRAMHAEGSLSLSAIAERFGTTKQHVSRLVRGEQRSPIGDLETVPMDVSVTDVVSGHLKDEGVDVESSVAGITALALAEKLDAVRASPTAQSAMAAPGVARALAETLSDLGIGTGRAGARLGSMRGEEAVLLAKELGMLDPENVDEPYFDEVTLIKIRSERRRGRPHKEWS